MESIQFIIILDYKKYHLTRLFYFQQNFAQSQLAFGVPNCLPYSKGTQSIELSVLFRFHSCAFLSESHTEYIKRLKKNGFLPDWQLQSRPPEWSLDKESTCAIVWCFQYQALSRTYLDLSHLVTRTNQCSPALSALWTSVTRMQTKFTTHQ